MFQKILLPTDGSRHSAEAARFAADLAKCHGGTVEPIVAVEYQFIHSEELSAEVSAHLRERIDARARKALDAAEQTIREQGANHSGGRIVEGTPVEAILEAAGQHESDLIVMGSRGVSLDRGHDRLIGSVTERVLHRAPCPVLVIRAETL